MTQEISKTRFDNGNQFTEKYFMEEINRFREACGQKIFWAMDEEKQQAMIDGLSFCYLNIVNEDGSQPTTNQINQWAFIFEQAIDNYNRRKTTLLMLPLKRALGLA